MSITLDTVGRRIYLRGNTYPVREQIREAGAKWDPEAKCWYVGVQRREVAERIAAECAEAKPAGNTESISTAAKVITGRAKYQGKSYYLLADGRSRQTGRPYAKLAFRDGSKVFWAADLAALEITKRYQEPTSIDALQAYAERMKRERETGECECRCHTSDRCDCPRFCELHHDGCERCGCEA